MVVDGSDDGTLEMLKAEFPKVHVVQGDGSWWYTKSMNEGFKYAEILNPDFVLTLNDDVEIRNSYLNNLLSSYTKINRNSIIGSLSLSTNSPHLITNSGYTLKNKFFGIYQNYLPFLMDQKPELLFGIKETVALPGRGILIPYHVLKELDYFDERFVQYHSDTDFCLRAKEDGIMVYISWDAIVYSNVNMTSYSSSYKNKSISALFNSFFDKYSRNYIPSLSRLVWRHNTKIGFPVVFVFKMMLIFKNYLLQRMEKK